MNQKPEIQKKSRKKKSQASPPKQSNNKRNLLGSDYPKPRRPGDYFSNMF